eukprot:g5100.t1
MVQAVVSKVPAAELTFRKVREALEAQAGCDLSSRKAEIKEYTMVALEKLKEKQEKPKAEPKPPKKMLASYRLSEFLGETDPNEMLLISRKEVNERLRAYFKDNNLYDEDDRRVVILDEALYKVFRVKKFTVFKMQKHLSDHLKDPKKMQGQNEPETSSEEEDEDEAEEEEEDDDDDDDDESSDLDEDGEEEGKPKSKKKKKKKSTTKAKRMKFPEKKKRKLPSRHGVKYFQSSYMHFSQSFRPQLKAENPDASFVEQAKMLGARWKSMDAAARAPYEATAQADKERYRAEVGEKGTKRRKTPKKKKSTGGSAKPNAFQKPVRLSSELAAVLGGVTEMPRTMVTKELWKYIKEHELQNPADGREIVCDEKLKVVMGGVDRVHMMKMQGFLKAHMRNVEKE